jgi:site-specific DNA-methyltransferase (adenine-specific)
LVPRARVENTENEIEGDTHHRLDSRESVPPSAARGVATGLLLVPGGESTTAAPRDAAGQARFKGMRPYYDRDGITLYCGVYRDVLPELKQKFALLLTDPPYGTTSLEWDKPADWPFFWQEVNRLCKPAAPQILFSAGQFTADLLSSNRDNYRYDLVWEKPQVTGYLKAKGQPLRTHENILVFCRQLGRSVYNPQMVNTATGKIDNPERAGAAALYSNKPRTSSPDSPLRYPRSVLKFNNPRAAGRHASQKPIDLVRWLMRTYSNRGALVLDPFVGSGTTLVAAQLLERSAVGIEKSEATCKDAVERLRAAHKFLKR